MENKKPRRDSTKTLLNLLSIGALIVASASPHIGNYLQKRHEDQAIKRAIDLEDVPGYSLDRKLEYLDGRE